MAQDGQFPTTMYPAGPPQPLGPCAVPPTLSTSRPQAAAGGVGIETLRPSDPLIVEAGEPEPVRQVQYVSTAQPSSPVRGSLLAPGGAPLEPIFYETPIPTPAATQPETALGVVSVPTPAPAASITTLAPSELPPPNGGSALTPLAGHRVVPASSVPASVKTPEVNNFVPISEAPGYIDSTLPAYTVIGGGAVPPGVIEDRPVDRRFQYEGWTRTRDGEPVLRSLPDGRNMSSTLSVLRDDDKISADGWLLAGKGGAELHASEASEHNAKFKNDLAGRFPLIFTLFCFTVFTIPIYLVYNIGQDPQVKYWITGILRIVVVLPIFYLFTHIWHILRGSPSRLMVALCTIGSCFLVLFLADIVLISSYQLGNKFAAKDCTTFEGKRELELEWQAAQKFYANCMANTAAYAKETFEEAVATYRIQDCTGYEDQLPVYPSWKYLETLEKQNRCSGWCTREQPLWTSGVVKDSCSATVADIMYNKIQWTMMQVVVYTIICLGFVSVVFITAGPVLRKQGVEW